MPVPPISTPKPPGPVRVQWCSDKVPHDETITPNVGESTNDFNNRVAAEVLAMLQEDRPSNDCTPPFP